MAATQVVIVSTSGIIRGGIQQLIAQSDSKIAIAGSFNSFAEASTFMRENTVRVLVIDDSLPHGSSLTKELKKLMDVHPGVAIVMIAQRPTVSLLQLMLQIGARGILHKDDDLERTLAAAIQMAASGGTTISPRVSQMMDQQPTLPRAVTQRDLDVLIFSTEGLQPKEIAAHIGVDKKVIYRSIEKMCKVFDAQNVAQLVDTAHQRKLLPPKK